MFLALLILLSPLRSSADQWDDISNAGVITIGLDPTYPPFQYYDTDGNLTGFEVELAQRLGQILGVDVEFIPSAWDPIIPNLQTGLFDIIMSAMTITVTRELEVDFTNPYFHSSYGAAVKAGNPLNISKLSDINNGSIMLRFPSFLTTWVQTNIPLAQTTIIDTTDNGINNIENGNIDVYISFWSSIARKLVESNNLNVEVVLTELGDLTDFGIATRTGEIILRERLNTAIGFAYNDGSFLSLIQKWFGVSDYPHIDDYLPNQIGVTTTTIYTTIASNTTISNTYDTTSTHITFIEETKFITVSTTVEQTEFTTIETTTLLTDSKSEVSFNPILLSALSFVTIFSIIRRSRNRSSEDL